LRLWKNEIWVDNQIKKNLKVDYPRGRAKGYYANFISAQKLKIEFLLFHPSINLQLPVDISPEIQGRVYGNPRQSLEEFF
jgi:hypothetical protein